MNNCYNAYIKNWWIKYDDCFKKVVLRLEIRSTIGNTVIIIPTNEIDHLFKIFHILDINKLKNTPCLALITNNCIRTIGNFMFVSVADIYSDVDKIRELDSKAWLDYDIYLQYKDEE